MDSVAFPGAGLGSAGITKEINMRCLTNASHLLAKKCFPETFPLPSSSFAYLEWLTIKQVSVATELAGIGI